MFHSSLAFPIRVSIQAFIHKACGPSSCGSCELYFATPQATCTTCIFYAPFENISSSGNVIPIHILNMAPLRAPSLPGGGWGDHCPCAVRLEKQPQMPQCLCSQHSPSLSTIDCSLLLSSFLFTDSEYPYSSNDVVFFITSLLCQIEEANKYLQNEQIKEYIFC